MYEGGGPFTLEVEGPLGARTVLKRTGLKFLDDCPFDPPWCPAVRWARTRFDRGGGGAGLVVTSGLVEGPKLASAGLTSIALATLTGSRRGRSWWLLRSIVLAGYSGGLENAWNAGV